MHTTPQLKNTIRKEFDKAIEITEHSQVPCGLIKKYVIHNLFKYWQGESEGYLLALMMVYNYGKEDGKKENEDCLDFKKKAMFQNVKTFLERTDLEKPQYKDFDKWENELILELQRTKA